MGVTHKYSEKTTTELGIALETEANARLPEYKYGYYSGDIVVCDGSLQSVYSRTKLSNNYLTPIYARIDEAALICLLISVSSSFISY
ncbi:hypothetical protein TNCV_4469891 [Trichonephila clavipes]|nr:hypothetical protein TNCV_4469891 [Trichonephila clavipes]